MNFTTALLKYEVRVDPSSAFTCQSQSSLWSPGCLKWLSELPVRHDKYCWQKRLTYQPEFLFLVSLGLHIKTCQLTFKTVRSWSSYTCIRFTFTTTSCILLGRYQNSIRHGWVKFITTCIKDTIMFCEHMCSLQEFCPSYSHFKFHLQF